VAQGLSSASGGGNGGTDVASKDDETNKHHGEMAPVDEHKDLVLDQDVPGVHAAVLRSLKSRRATCSMQRATLMSSQLPFEVHATHLAVLCGGYVGCLVCGRVAGFSSVEISGSVSKKRYAKSQQSAYVAFFAQRCRLHCPKGSSGAVRRLVQGQLPHSVGKSRTIADEWPSGEQDPQPVLLSQM
jgi:hypothetical protein